MDRDTVRQIRQFRRQLRRLYQKFRRVKKKYGLEDDFDIGDEIPGWMVGGGDIANG